MRRWLRRWSGFGIPCVDSTGRDGVLLYVGPRYHAIWYSDWRLERWRVEGIATGVQVGRLHLLRLAN